MPPADRLPVANGAMPQPDEKTAIGKEFDSFDNLFREREVERSDAPARRENGGPEGTSLV